MSAALTNTPKREEREANKIEKKECSQTFQIS
jgi:hypothetical protein